VQGIEDFPKIPTEKKLPKKRTGTACKKYPRREKAS